MKIVYFRIAILQILCYMYTNPNNFEIKGNNNVEKNKTQTKKQTEICTCMVRSLKNHYKGVNI